MNTRNIDNMFYDYYSNTETYLKTILNILTEEQVSSDKRRVLIKQFNYEMGMLNEDELESIILASRLFSEKLALFPKEYAIYQALEIYNTFLQNMLFDSAHLKKYFDVMNECIKVKADYYRKTREFEWNADYSINSDTISNIGSR